MYTAATYFKGIIVNAAHTDWGGLIDDTGIAASAQSSTETTPSIHRQFTPDESDMFIKMRKNLHFFLSSCNLQEAT
jgi:hypothetical protein